SLDRLGDELVDCGLDSSGASRAVSEIPGDCSSNAVFKTDLGSPAKPLLCSCRIEAPPRLSVGLCGVPLDPPTETRFASDQFDEILDLDLVAGAEVDRRRLVDAFRGGEDSLGGVIDVEKLAG